MSTPHRLIDLSKWVSWALRHDPQAAGISLDASGWTTIDELLAAAVRARKQLIRSELEEVVATSDKRRFAISDDGTSIRANQGHSVSVDLGLQPRVPPAVLFHGTTERFISSILRDGLKRGSRQHVHMSADLGTATAVGTRHGRPVILRIDAASIHAEGLHFLCSENGVWLTDAVPAKYISLDSSPATVSTPLKTMK